MPKFVLAYSGGLDTSVILKWLQIHHDADVVTLTADLGQKRELVGVKEKALLCGASATYVEDLQHEFVDEYVWPTLKAGALYQEVYPLGSAIGRPLIVKRLVDVAREVGADAIVHGCTGKGNDQVRFEVGVAALAPDLHCLAPVRTWELKSREEEIAWAQAHHVPVSATRKSPYSIDENLWGVSIEAGQLEDPWAEPPPDCWQMTVSPESAPAKPEHLTLGFEHGVPVSIDGRALDGVELLGELNLRAASHGIGRIDMIEDRVVGIKSREVYEAPAAVTLHTARQALEQLTLDRETRRAKAALGQELARLVYDGLWFSPLRESINAFVDQATRAVSGEVKLKLHRGHVMPVARRSPNALYDPALATYAAGDAFNHESAGGFIEIFGLPSRAGRGSPTSAEQKQPGVRRRQEVPA
jgi:argininosuccinate synthase